MLRKPRKYTFRKYTAPAYIVEALETLRPPEDITVSQWAERDRVLDEKSSRMPGHWSNAVTPYLVGIMDEFSNWETEQIVFCKPTQVGGTEALNNMLGYATAQDPGPTLIVEPTEKLAESYSETRLVPLILKCKPLREKFHRKGSTKLELQFDGTYISLTGSNTASGLASKPIRYLFLDEVDKYPKATQTEADPVSLANERTKTYTNRKVYMCSTPTTVNGRIWKEKEAADVEKHYFVPCPHCQHFIELKFSQIRWPERKPGVTLADRAEAACYVCQECGCVINDADKMVMLQKGEWRPVRQTATNPKTVAFWMNTLYSPFTRFAEIAKEFLLSQDDPEKLHNFTNSWLAEPWEDTRLRSSPDVVKERETDVPEFTVPQWCKLLTGGVDVQKTHLYYTIRAWGNNMTSQLVTRGQALSFETVERIMNLPYKREDGTDVLVDLCLIDSGDQTDTVYDFAARNTEWCLPAKGTGQMLSHYKLSVVNKAGSQAVGMKLVLVDGGKYKDMIYSRMRRENGEGSWMVFKDIDMEYCQQVTSEHKVVERTPKGEERLRWAKKFNNADNHYFDCEVYSFAAADVLGVRTLFLQEQEQAQPPQPRNPQHHEPQQQAPADSWILGHDQWL